MSISVIPGDGIGPEVTREAVRVLKRVAAVYGHDFEFHERDIAFVALADRKKRIFDSDLQQILLAALRGEGGRRPGEGPSPALRAPSPASGRGL